MCVFFFFFFFWLIDSLNSARTERTLCCDVGGGCIRMLGGRHHRGHCRAYHNVLCPKTDVGPRKQSSGIEREGQFRITACRRPSTQQGRPLVLNWIGLFAHPPTPCPGSFCIIIRHFSLSRWEVSATGIQWTEARDAAKHLKDSGQ